MRSDLMLGDSAEILKTLDGDSIDSVVTDPPYGLSFMNKHWDYDVPSVDLWREVLRVLKPGGHVLSFGGTRTYHRMVVNIEDAGFEIRDQLQWIYGSGFPKSHNLNGEWQGWGTALKPANEPIVLARKPLVGTVAENVQTFGTGALNIDASRIGYGSSEKIDFTKVQDGNIYGGNGVYGKAEQKHTTPLFKENGRWPANVLFDEEAAAVLDAQSGQVGKSNGNGTKYNYAGKEYNNRDSSMFNGDKPKAPSNYNDTGGASRFFYVSKASNRERGEGNNHPTVKPIKLMEYLVRLITPPGGTVLDPFMGSGTTGIACKNMGFNFVGIERSSEYLQIATARIRNSEQST